MQMQRHISDKIVPLLKSAGFISDDTQCCTALCYTDNFAIAKLNTETALSYEEKSGSRKILEFLIPNTSAPYLSGDGAVYYSEVNTVYKVSPEQPFNAQYKSTDMSFTYIIISRTYFEQVMNSKHCDFSVFSAPFYASASLSAFIELFVSEFEKESCDDENVLIPLSRIIVSGLIGSALKNNESEKNVASYFKGIRIATEYINENYDKKLSIEDLADACGLSYSYFSNCFKRTFGDTPKGYITNLRLNKAKYYLTETALPIKEIASKCGFAHFNTFTSAFKKYVGVSPREYRSNRKKSAALSA